MDLKRSGEYKLDGPPEVLSAVFVATVEAQAYPRINRYEPFKAVQGQNRYDRRDQSGVPCSGESSYTGDQSRLDTPRALTLTLSR